MLQKLSRNSKLHSGSGKRCVQNLSDVEYWTTGISGGGFSFLSHSLALRSDVQQIVEVLFKDKKNALLKLKKKVDGSERYTLIQPHPNYTDIDFGVLMNNYSG